MRQVLALVIAGAASENGTFDDTRLEGGSLPQIEGFGRLHIVVAVNDVMGAAFGALAEGAGQDDGVAAGGMHLGVQTDLLAVLQQPCGTGDEIALVLRLGGDAGESDIVAEVLKEPLLILIQILQNFFHSECLAELGQTSKGEYARGGVSPGHFAPARHPKKRPREI